MLEIVLRVPNGSVIELPNNILTISNINELPKQKKIFFFFNKQNHSETILKIHNIKREFSTIQDGIEILFINFLCNKKNCKR